ncbi:MAG: hypothetical protein ACRCV3_00990 [Desulfovibrionaceae bacterium]
MNVKKIFFMVLASVLIMPTADVFARQGHQMHNSGASTQNQGCCSDVPTIHAIATTKGNEKILAPISLANTRLFNAVQSGNMDAAVASAKEVSLAIDSIKDAALKASFASAQKYANDLVQATTYSQVRLGYGLLVSSLSSHFVDCGEAPRIHNPQMQDKSAIRGKEQRMRRMQMLHYVPDLKVHDATMKNLLSLRLEMKQLRATIMNNNSAGTAQTLKNISSLLFTIDKQSRALRGYTRDISIALNTLGNAKTFLARLEGVNGVSDKLFTMYGVIDMSGVSVEDLQIPGNSAKTE